MPRCLPTLALLCAGLAAAAPASEPIRATRAAEPATPERERIAALMRRAVEAARAELQKVRSDRLLGEADRQESETQYARILRHAEGCEAAAAFARQAPRIMASGVELLIADSIRHGDRPCADVLAPLMLERWEDMGYVPAWQVSFKFRAGAFLDAAGRPEGRRIRDEAEAELARTFKSDSLWSTRFGAIDAYADTPRLMPYLEYLADGLVADPRGPMESTRNGILAIFAFYDRCDLVARVAGPGPGSCDRPRADAKAMYVDPSPSLIESARAMARALELEAPTLDEQGLAAAIEGSDSWGRMTRLLVFVSASRRALDGLPEAGKDGGAGSE